MQFLWASFLWSLWIIPILLAAYIWAQRRPSRFALRFPNLAVVRAARAPASARRHLPAAVLLFGLTALLLALARPQLSVVVAEPAQTIIITIDVSESMRGSDIEPNRIEAAKTAARTFVRGASPEARIGVVAFSTTASIVQTPTRDHDAVVAAIDGLGLEGNTAIGRGILVSLQAIFGNLAVETNGGDIFPAAPGADASPHPPRGAIILLTDGANVEGTAPEEAAQKAADLGVRIFAVGVGTSNGRVSAGTSPGRSSDDTRPVELDEATLKQVTQVTGGEYYLARDAETLVRIYEKLTTESIVFTEQIEITSYLSAAALVVLLAATGLGLVFNRLP